MALAGSACGGRRLLRFIHGNSQLCGCRRSSAGHEPAREGHRHRFPRPEDFPHTERIKLKKKPGWVSIRIESEPPGAQVWLGDTMLGVTPFSDELIEQKKRFVFEIDHARCERKRIKLSGRRDDSKHVRLTCQ